MDHGSNKSEQLAFTRNDWSGCSRERAVHNLACLPVQTPPLHSLPSAHPWFKWTAMRTPFSGFSLDGLNASLSRWPQRMNTCDPSEIPREGQISSLHSGAECTHRLKMNE